ncbi:MAG TPA: MbnP family protein [Luteibaculaceae bacterium]|nr:MbnP family protein [Luteibaculaceae bacterium]
MKFTYSIFLFLFVLISCTKENTPPTPPQPIETPTGEMILDLDPKWGAGDLILGQTYTNASNESITPTVFRYYVSNVALTTTTGEIWNQTESYYLVDHANGKQALVITGVPEGAYRSISFSIGVDSLRNVSGAQEGALDPIKGMFWSWNTGYIFSKFEGTSPQSTEANQRFSYHVGGFKSPNNALRRVTLSFPHEEHGGVEVNRMATPEVHIHADASGLFNRSHAISVASDHICHMPGALAMKIADNYQGIFTIDHVH